MDLNASFTLRFKTRFAGLDFIADADCESIAALRPLFDQVYADGQDIEFVGSLIYLDLAKPSSGCYLLDDEGEKLFASLLKHLRLDAEHFMNERLGWYDNINNRVTPADLGTVFPDGSMHLVWQEEHALLDFDQSLAIAKGALELLLHAQEIPYCTQTEAEVDDGDYDGVEERRCELLFKAGLWPADDGSFEDELKSNDEIKALIAEYCGKAVPKPQPA